MTRFWGWRTKENLFELAKEYVALIEKIEKTSDPQKLQVLDEKRAELHWKFIDQLKVQGIKFKDRYHATRIAYRIVNEELWHCLKLPKSTLIWFQ